MRTLTAGARTRQPSEEDEMTTDEHNELRDLVCDHLSNRPMTAEQRRRMDELAAKAYEEWKRKHGKVSEHG